MPDFAVSTKYTAVDNLTSAHNRMGSSAERMGKRVQRSARGAEGALGAMGATAGGVFMGGAMLYGTALARRSLAAVADEALQLDSNLTQAGAKFLLPVKRGSKGMAELEAAAKRVGSTTQFTSAQAAQGLDFLAMAGFNAAQSIAALPGLAELATAANMDMARASDIASDALGAFGLMTDDTKQLATNLTRVNDVFARTVTTSNTTMETLFETMKASGPVVKTAGSDIETFAAMTGILGSASIKGGDAGTALKNIFLRLAGPVPKAAAMLGKLGVKTKDSAGNMRDMFDIMQDLRVATKGMGTATRSAAMDTLFGKYAVAGANVLLDTGADKLKAYRDQLYGAKGASADMSAEMRKSLINRLAILKSVLMDKGLDIGKALTGGRDMGEVLDRVTAWVSKIDTDKIVEIGKSVGKIAAGFAVFKGVSGMAGTLMSLGSSVALLSNPVVALAAGIGALSAAALLFPDKFKPLTDVFRTEVGPIIDSAVGGFNSLKGLVLDVAGGSDTLVSAWAAVAKVGIFGPLQLAASGFEKVAWGIRYVNELATLLGPKLGFVTGYFEKSTTVMKALLWPFKKIVDLYAKLFSMLGDGAFAVMDFATGGSLTEARTNMDARDKQRGIDERQRVAANAVNALGPAGDFTGNFGQSMAPPPAVMQAQVESTVNLQITGLPQGMSAEATSTSRSAPPVNMALAGAR